MTTMETREYVKAFCGGDEKTFWRMVNHELKKIGFRWGAYEAYTTYYDAERDIKIEHTTYIGGD